MSNTINDKDFFQGLIKKNYKDRANFFKKNCSITDIELIACEFYYDVTKQLRRNLANELGRGVCVEEKKLLEDILKVRCWKLDSNFTWTENYKKQLLELNEKVMNGFSMAYEEAETQFNILKGRIRHNDSYLKGFNIKIKLNPFILEPNDDEYYLGEKEKGIYYLLYNLLPDVLWSDGFVADEHNLDNIISRKYVDDGENYNINEYLGEETFNDSGLYPNRCTQLSGGT